MRTALAFLASLALPGCFNLEFSRRNADEPIEAAAVAHLQPGRDDLSSCLSALGAPTRVWEGPEDSVLLAYGWLLQSGWGVAISYAIQQFVSASFSYSDDDKALRGVVLRFDHGLVLREVREGLLADLADQMRRRRPSSPQ